MPTKSIHESKAHLSGMRAAVERRDEVFIARRGKTVALLVSTQAPERKASIRFGRFAGQVHIEPSFYDDMPEEELAQWYGDDPDNPLNEG